MKYFYQIAPLTIDSAAIAGISCCHPISPTTKRTKASLRRYKVSGLSPHLSVLGGLWAFFYLSQPHLIRVSRPGFEMRFTRLLFSKSTSPSMERTLAERNGLKSMQVNKEEEMNLFQTFPCFLTFVRSCTT